MTEQPPTPEHEKSICFRFPRYDKRSLFTESAAVIIPSAIYALQLMPLKEVGFGRILTFFAHPLAVVFNTYSSFGFQNSLYLSIILQLAFVMFLHVYKKITPRYALALAITLGMMNLLGLKLLAIN